MVRAARRFTAAAIAGAILAAWLRTRDTDPATMSLETVVSRLVMR